MSKFHAGKKMITLAAALLAAAITGCSAYEASHRTPMDARGVPMLKEIYRNDFLIGTAVDFRTPEEFSPRELEIIKTQFSVITPENSMKPQVHAAPDRWNWTVPDRLVEFCQANNIKVHGHTLAWHAQTPQWFFVDDDGKTVTREEAIDRLKEHIQTVVGHFKGKVYSWDVVNEAISDGGNGEGENLRNSSWIRAIGPDYITMAFKFAHEADPDTKLYYNDYSIERGNKHKSSLVLLSRLIRDGAPIYGVGIQGHWSLNNTPYKDIDKAIADYKALGLKVSISELDITISGQGGGQLGTTTAPGGGSATQPGRGRGRGFGGGRGRGQGGAAATATAPTTTSSPSTNTAETNAATNPAETNPATNPAETGPATNSATTAPATGRGRGFGRGFGGGAGRGFGRGPSTPPTPEQLRAQADAYARIFEIFLKHKDTVERVTFWGLNDRRSWRAGQNPLIFDGDNDPKPAIAAIARVGQAWWPFR